MTQNTNNTNADNFLSEFLSRQCTNIEPKKKLQYNDLKRISKNVKNSIFDENICSKWNGYITNTKNKNKGTYVNFYFRRKKMALHRLLYVNFVGNLSNNEYLKFSCENRGSCCNIHHMKKFKYQISNDEKKDGEENIKQTISKVTTSIKSITMDNDLFIDFNN